jgi:hypothetical protein
MNIYTIEYPRPLSKYHGPSLGLLRDQGLQRGLDKDFHTFVLEEIATFFALLPQPHWK